jgi:hypothetical protein
MKPLASALILTIGRSVDADRDSADISRKQLRPKLHHSHTNDRTPGVAEHDYSSFLQPATKILHNLDPILCDLLQSDVRRTDSVTTVRVTGTTLIPLDDSKCLLPRTIHLGHGPLRFAGSAVNHQKHWITRICTPDVDPLTEPADRLERRLTNTGAKRCRRYSDSNSQDELRGANRERTAVQVHTRIWLGFVSCDDAEPPAMAIRLAVSFGL